MTSTTNAPPAEKQPIEYASEVRFGVVLYGGVSLAIYINGVANEIYEMVCATPKDGPGAGAMTGTREVYRRLAWLADNSALREKYCRLIESRQQLQDGRPPQDVWDEKSLAYLQPVRLVVDVISGTSAGGINGIFLAKALASGEQFAPLKELWVQEGDLALLLNDSRSYRGLTMGKRKTPPESLLNSDRMYLKLFEALETMSSTAATARNGALVDEMDLFVTTTDIAGAPVPLRLSGQVVYERRHKQNFHFSWSQGTGRNDFCAGNNGLLAFAARCTSAFPFAFEPMTMAAASRLKPDFSEAIKKDWYKFLSNLPKPEVDAGRHIWRAFGDGGYLDNKPFTYVAKTLATRQAIVPVERKLIYVEPAPETINVDELPGADAKPPDALANALAALSSIPRYETIREDLQEVLRRNRSIERVERIEREGETDLYEMLKGDTNPLVRILKASDGTIPPWPEFKRKDMVRYYGTAFLAYRRMRVSSATDELAYAVARHWGVDFRSDYWYALAALLREWCNLHYQEDPEDGRHETINAFLDRFDIDYRIRKLSFLLRQTDHLARLMRKLHLTSLTKEEFHSLPESDKHNIGRLEKEGWRLRDQALDSGMLDRAIDALHILKIQLNEAQGKWRLIEHKRKELFSETKFFDDKLQEELSAVLSLLLGEVTEISLTTRSGGTITMRLSEDVLKACACERTMEHSVLRRTKELLALLAPAERTRLYKALKDHIESMILSQIDPSSWKILGEPTLELARPEAEEKVIVKVGYVDNEILNSPEAILLRRLLGEYYLYFDLFDQMSFPLYRNTGIGEPSTMEVVRISPADARNLIDEAHDKRRKLAGTALANFGAFIDCRWRQNDIMWGRLDGAERLIQTLLPMSDHSTEVVRKELTEQAHRTILREELVPDGGGKVADLMCKALAEMPGNGDRMQQIRDLLKRVIPDESHRYEHLASMLMTFMNEQTLMDYVRTTRDVDRNPDPQTMFSNVSRAATISGRMFDAISKRYGAGTFAFRWLARLGLMLQGLIAVSLPGSWKAHWWLHAMSLLYVVEFALLMLTLLPLGVGELRGPALAVLAATLTIHAMMILLSDWIHSRGSGSRRLIRMLLPSAVLAVMVLAGVGGLALYHLHWRAWLYGESPDGQTHAAFQQEAGALPQSGRR